MGPRDGQWGGWHSWWAGEGAELLWEWVEMQVVELVGVVRWREDWEELEVLWGA